MSIRLMSVVWDLDLPPGEKLVLLALADQANDAGVQCWPSVATIAKRSGQSERTVQRAIVSLEKARHLTSHQRSGTSTQYHVHPCANPNPSEYHYVYRVDHADTGEFYVGGRSSYDEPSVDPYMGSSTWIDAARKAGAPLIKTVLSLHDTRADMAAAETAAIGTVISMALCRNKRVSTPDNMSPRHFVTPSPCHPTPDTMSPKPPRTTNSLEADASKQTRAKRTGWPVPAGVSPEQWDGFCRQRKKPLNERAYAMLTAKLETLSRSGWPPGELIDTATERGWETVFEPRNNRNADNRTSDSLRGARPDPALDMWRDAVAEERAAAACETADRRAWPALPAE